MKTIEKVVMRDRMVLICHDKRGRVKWKTDTETDPLKSNSMSKYGLAQMAALLLTDVGGDAFDFIGIGDDNTAESKDHDDLISSIKRKAGTGTQITTTETDDTLQIVVAFAAADTLSGTDQICEGGVFTLAAAGVMLYRSIFTAKPCNWDDGDTLTVTATCQMKQGA